MLVNDQPTQLQKATPKMSKVLIRYVKDVSSYDYPQAKIAWDALIEAGIEPGELVADGLSAGHGYQIEDLGLYQSFSQKSELGLLQQNISSETSLVSYKYRTGESRLVLPESPENSLNSASIIRRGELIKVSEEEVDTVEMVAVIPEAPEMINPPKIPQFKLRL